MTHESLIVDLAIVLAVAATTGLVARWLRQPSVLGYLFAGLVVGPYIPIPIFANPARVEAMAEFGVVLVMFAVGLEFRLGKLRSILPSSGLTALLQVSFLLWAGFVLGGALGWATTESVFLGACLCISSTMLVSRVFQEQRVSEDVRRHVLGVLVLQDIAAIVLIAAMTALATSGQLAPAELSSTILRLLVVLGGLLGVGLLLVPRAVRAVVRIGSKELLVVCAIALCFGLAELAEVLGYSVALGAFVAGILAAESGRAHDVELQVAPLRDLFAAIFFVSIGMSVDPLLAWQHLPVTLVAFAVVVMGQALSVTVAGTLSGNGLRASITSGLALGQIGEFAFILAGIGASAGVVRPELRAILVTVAVLTAFTTPLLLRLSPQVVEAVDKLLPMRLRRLIDLQEDWVERLRLSPSTGLGHQQWAKPLKRFVLDAAVALGVMAMGVRAGPAAARWLAARSGVEPVVIRSLLAALVLALFVTLLVAATKNALALGTLLASAAFPTAANESVGVQVSRRTLRVVLLLVMTLGFGLPAIAVLRPILGSAIGGATLAVLVLAIGAYLWRTANALDAQFESGVEKLAGLLARQAGENQGSGPLHDPALVPGLDHAKSLNLAPHAFAVGKTLVEIHLRALTSATVVAIRRADGSVELPSGREPLGAGDVLALVGNDDALVRARSLLERGPEGLVQERVA